VKQIEEALRLDPASSPGHSVLGMLQVAQGRRDEAETCMRSALAIDPHDVLANRTMAAFCMATGQSARAERYFRAVADASSTTAGKLPLADCYVASGRYGEAVRLLESLARDRRAPAEVSEAYLADGDRARAEKLVDGLLARAPRNAGALLLKNSSNRNAGMSVRAVVRTDASQSG